MINITFHIYLLGSKTWDENAKENPSLSDQIFEGGNIVEGALKIFRDDILTNILQDELLPLIKNLCFGESRKLLQQDHTQYEFYSYPGHIDFTKQDDKILLTGEDVNSTAYDAQELATAFYQCGERFMSFLQDFKNTNGETASLLSLIDILEAERLSA